MNQDILKEVVGLLYTSFTSIDNDTRKQAEKQIKELEHNNPKYVIYLMQIVSSSQLELPIRKSAAVSLRSLIRKRWLAKEDDNEEDDNEYSKYSPFPADVQKVIKEKILDVIISVPPVLQSLIGIAMHPILESDFPQNWPELIPKILNCIKSDNKQVMYGGLATLRTICKRYEFKDEESGQRDTLYQIINTCFPFIDVIFDNLMKFANPNEEIGEFLLIVIKLFWNCTQYHVPPYLQNDRFTKWLNMLHDLLKRPLPSGQPELNPENWVWWKLKRWLVHLFNRLFYRYATSTHAEKSVTAFNKQLSQVWRNQIAPSLMETFISILSTSAQKNYVPRKVIAVCLNFMGNCLRISQTYKKLKPHMEKFLIQILFPLFCFNKEDKEIWDEDPHEFIRKEFDLEEDFWDPRLTGLNLVLDIIRMRGNIYLTMLLDHCSKVLNAYANSPPDKKNYPEKDGALLVLGNLVGPIGKLPEVNKSLEGLLMRHVYSEFDNPLGFMRARACWIVGQYFHVPFSSPQNFLKGLESVMKLTEDKELVVRVKAALSLKLLILNKIATNVLKPHLGKILEIFFNILNEVEADEIVKGLETIIQRYGEEISPYAVQMTKRLGTVFMKLIEADEDDDNAGLAANECLSAIEVLLDAVAEVKGMYVQLEPIIHPLLLRLLEPDAVEFFDETIKIISYLTYYSDSISAKMWELFPLIYRAFNDWAVDWMDQLIIPLDNYISRGTDVFLSGPPLEMTCKMYEKLMSSDVSDADSGEGAKLIEVVLQNCKGKINNLVPNIVDLAVKRMQKGIKSKSVMVYLVEVVANAIYYDPVRALKILEEKNYTTFVFAEWFKLISLNKFERMIDKKVCIMSLSSLLAIPLNEFPVTLRNGVPKIISSILDFIRDFQEQKTLAELSSSSDDEEEDYDEVEDGELDDDEDENEVLEDDEDAAGDVSPYLQAIDDSYNELVADVLTDSEIHTTPLDDVDEVEYFLNGMKFFSEKYPDPFNSLLSALSAEHIAYLKSIKETNPNKTPKEKD